MKRHLLTSKYYLFRNSKILILAAFFLSVSVKVYAQSVSLSVKNEALAQVISDIKKQTGYSFIYTGSMLQKANSVSVQLKDIPVQQALSIIMENQPFSYSLVDRTIVLKPFESTNKRLKNDSTNRQIKGTVRDEDGKPLVAVSVAIIGTSAGTLTNEKGEYSIQLKTDGGELEIKFSALGYVSKTIKVKKQSAIDIVLQSKVYQHGEMVITGYQKIKKSRMTGSVSTITMEEIANKGYTNVSDILKGQLPGVAAMSLSGRPGASAQIRIRGINSLTGHSDPMWIVDGMPLQGDVPSISTGGTEFQETVLTDGIGNIAPEDIESITVLKDAAASAIYGARAANGVIVITTKHGTAGQSRINLQASYAISEAPKNRLVMMNSQQKIAFEKGIYEDFPGLNLGGRVYQVKRKIDKGILSKAEGEEEIHRLSQINTNWFDEIFRKGQTQNHSISLSGGSEKTQYYASLSYLNQVGVMPNNKYDSRAANLKLTHNFNEKLRIHFNVMTSTRNDRNSASMVNPLDYATFANPYEHLYNKDGSYAYDRSYYPQLSTIEDGYKYDFNILKDLNENTQKSKYISSQASLKLEYQILNGLMLSSRGIFSNSNTHTKSELTPGSYSSKSSSWVKNIYPEGETPAYLNNGKMSETTSRAESWTIRNQIEFSKGLGHGNHYVDVLIGQEVSSQKGYGFSNMIPEWNPLYGVATYPDLTGLTITPDISFKNLGSHQESQDRSVSLFATGTYSYRDKYIVAGSARMDGVDIIGTANRFSPLWNISGRWNAHEELFMKEFPAIDLLSIRFSYGLTGSIDRSVLPFSTMAKVGNLKYDGEDIFDRFNPASPPVKWQKKIDRNIGFDLSLFKHKVNFTFNYYRNDTKDLIGADRIAASTGRTTISSNVASLRNTGYEFSLRTMNIKTRNFVWTTSFNITTNKNVVTKTLLKSLEDYSVNTNSTFDDIYSLYIEGESVKSYYGYFFAGVDPLTGGTLAYVDGTDEKGQPLGSLNDEGKYVYNMELNNNYTAEMMNAARGFIGLSYPPITGGFGTQLNYKGFSLSTHFTFMTGHLIKSFQSYTSGGSVNATSRNVLAIEANRWRNPGDITTIPKYVDGRSEYLYQLFDFRFEKGDYLKCNNISLGYNFNSKVVKRLGLQRARLNLNLSNPFTVSNYRGIDPETMGAFTYPSARVYNLSISVGF